MSSYGEDYSDEEQNYIEHGGASQGESDIEGEGSGAGESVGGNTSASRNGDHSEGDERSGSSGGLVHSQAQEIESIRSEAEGESSGWDAYQKSTGNWHETSAETSIGGNVKKHPNESVKARSSF
ncbi:hypothetical protein IFR04_000987 [Cadophora malorum]|uniref:Uncharacterized protein n=1 Tax=Cadophora malorum TaxID=108018 RepID=A0A8H8BVM3_9HELO|nr:hypothetical protein IFR04_000987 [Cadophora malorum]